MFIPLMLIEPVLVSSFEAAVLAGQDDLPVLLSEELRMFLHDVIDQAPPLTEALTAGPALQPQS